MAILTPTAVTLPGSITIPADGENIDAADVNGPFQHIADGVAFTTAQLAVLADIAALAAIAAPTNGLVRTVRGFGLYEFRTSATTGLSPFRVAAGDATVGGWVSGTAYETAKTARAYLGQFSPLASKSAGALAAVGLNYAVLFAPATATDIDLSAFGFMTRQASVGANNWHFHVPLNALLIDGATLASATLRCRPAGSHVGLPTRQISLCLIRNTFTGSSGSSMPNPDRLISAPASGHVALAAASTAAYEADQGLVYTPNQNNVINKSLYSYAALIADEGGANALAGAAFASIELAMTGIPDARRA